MMTLKASSMGRLAHRGGVVFFFKMNSLLMTTLPMESTYRKPIFCMKFSDRYTRGCGVIKPESHLSSGFFLSKKSDRYIAVAMLLEN